MERLLQGFLLRYFNSQPHKEADDYSTEPCRWNSISTHSLTRRLTITSIYVTNISSYFNSQPHKEADKDVIVPSRPIWYFNSQPHKEADYSM